MKRCPKCDWHKPLSDFNRNKRTPDGLQTYCRLCQKVVCKASYEKNPRPRADLSTEGLARIRQDQREYYARNAQRVRERNLTMKFGITYEDKLAMHEAQEGLCGSCFGPLPPMGVEGVREPAVDHSHLTGKVRSLLDSNCNMADGLLGRDFRVAFSMGMYQLNDGPYFGPIAVISDLGTWTSVVKRVNGELGRTWGHKP